jgi:phosphoribosyl 1,2-cyclic phosphate phosphodiesterase
VEVEILGAGGATTAPRPGCGCRVCTEARAHGAPPHTRSGPSTFVHGPDLLFDTPEDARLQLDRARIGRIAACFYSHWHPDHTMGRRVWETRNGDFRVWPPEAKRQLATDVVDDGRRLLLAPDELNGWAPPLEVRGPDVAVLPMGICEHDPLTGERRIDPAHPVLRYEATFEETLAIVDALGAGRVVLAHLEEIDGLTYDDLVRLERIVGRGITFAYDGLRVEV